MSKSLVVGFTLATVLIVAGGAAAHRQHPHLQATPGVAPVRDEDRFDATPIQKGVMSAQQRKHSRLFTWYRDQSGGKTIWDYLAQFPHGDLEIASDPPLTVALDPDQKPESPEALLVSVAATSDAILRGTVERTASHVTDDQAFLFTDYSVRVLEVFKRTPRADLREGDVVVTTRAGGKISIDGRVVSALPASARLLEKGAEYVFFVNYDDRAETLVPFDAYGTFKMEGTAVVPALYTPRPQMAFASSQAFFRILRSPSVRGNRYVERRTH